MEHEDDSDTSKIPSPKNNPEEPRKLSMKLEIMERTETVQTTALLRSVRIPRRVLETWGDFLSLRLLWKITSYYWCEKLPNLIN